MRESRAPSGSAHPSGGRSVRRSAVGVGVGVGAAMLFLLLAASPFAVAQNGSGDKEADAPKTGAPEKGADAAPSGNPPTPVRAGRVEAKAIQDRRLVTGEVRAVRRARVAGREPGLILEAAIREGQPVKKGTLLARLDATQLELEDAKLDADRVVAEATLQEREADLSLKRWQHDAFKKLAERGSSHEQEIRQAESAIAVAIARERQARQALKVIDADKARLAQRIADMRIVAPFDAIVVARHAEQGEWLGAGGAVAELVSTGALEVWFQMPEGLAAAVRQPKASIEVRVDALGVTEHTTEFRAVPMVDPTTRTFPLIASIENSGGSLAAGMSATAWVPNGEKRRHLTVPVDALLRNEIGSFVYVARGAPNADIAQAVPIPVTRLFAHGSRVAVRAHGLNDGDRVVVEGNERLFPSAALKVLPEAPTEKATAPSKGAPADESAAANGKAR